MPFGISQQSQVLPPARHRARNPSSLGFTPEFEVRDEYIDDSPRAFGFSSISRTVGAERESLDSLLKQREVQELNRALAREQREKRELEQRVQSEIRILRETLEVQRKEESHVADKYARELMISSELKSKVESLQYHENRMRKQFEEDLANMKSQLSRLAEERDETRKRFERYINEKLEEQSRAEKQSVHVESTELSGQANPSAGYAPPLQTQSISQNTSMVQNTATGRDAPVINVDPTSIPSAEVINSTLAWMQRAGFVVTKAEPTQMSGTAPSQTVQQLAPPQAQTRQVLASTPHRVTVQGPTGNPPVYKVDLTSTIDQLSQQQSRIPPTVQVTEDVMSNVGDDAEQLQNTRESGIAYNTRRSGAGGRGYNILPKPYKGGDFLAFKETFEALSRVNQWDPITKVGHLMWCYQEGPANIIVSSRPNHDWTADELMQAGLEMFGNSISESQMRIKLKKIKRKPDETYSELLRRIIDVSKQAGGLSEQRRFNEERIAFMNAVEDNRPLYFHLDRKREEIHSMSQLLSVAMKFTNNEGASDDWVRDLLTAELEKRGIESKKTETTATTTSSLQNESISKKDEQVNAFRFPTGKDWMPKTWEHGYQQIIQRLNEDLSVRQQKELDERAEKQRTADNLEQIKKAILETAKAAKEEAVKAAKQATNQQSGWDNKRQDSQSWNRGNSNARQWPRNGNNRTFQPRRGGNDQNTRPPFNNRWPRRANQNGNGQSNGNQRQKSQQSYHAYQVLVDDDGEVVDWEVDEEFETPEPTQFNILQSDSVSPELQKPVHSDVKTPE